MESTSSYSAGRTKDTHPTENELDMAHKLFEGTREARLHFTPIPRPVSTLSERIAPLEVDINDIDMNDPSAGVYADLYQKCSPISADISRHRHQTTCLVHGDAASLRGYPHSPHGHCSLRTAAKSSQSQPVLQPRRGHHHDVSCARHSRSADDEFEKGEGGSSLVLAEEDLSWCGDPRRGGDYIRCHRPIYGEGCSTIIPPDYRLPYEQAVRKHSPQTLHSISERSYYDMTGRPHSKSRVVEETNIASASEHIDHLSEINIRGEHCIYDLCTHSMYLHPTPDCGHTPRVAVLPQRDDINGNAIMERCKDYEAAFNYYVDNPDGGRSSDRDTFHADVTSCVPVTAARPREGRLPLADTFHPRCHDTSNAHQPNTISAWRHPRGDASSPADDDSRLTSSRRPGVTGTCCVDEASHDRHARRRHIHRRRYSRTGTLHVDDSENCPCELAQSDASATSGSAGDSVDLTIVNLPIKPPTSPPTSPLESDHLPGPVPRPPLLSPALDISTLETEPEVSPNQQSDSSSDSRCLHDAVAQLPTPSVDLENLVTNSRGTVTPWNYAAESTDITTTANQRMTAGDGNAGLMTGGASAGLPLLLGAMDDSATRTACQLDGTESETRQRISHTGAACQQLTPRDFWDGDVLLQEIDDILIGSELGDDDDLYRRVCATDVGGSVDSRQGVGASADGGDLQLVQEHATKTNGFLCEMYKDGRLTDVIVEVEERQFKAHSVVLACHSEFFRQQLVGETASPPQHITCDPCVSATALKSILDYMYTGKLALTTDSVTEVLRAASELRLPAVEAQCRRLIGDLDAADALIVLEDAARLDMDDVCQSMLQTIGRDFSKATSSAKLLALSVDLLCRVFSSSQLVVASELDVLRSAVRWLQHDREARATHVRRIVECVRFSLMTSSELFAAAKLVDGYLDDPEISSMLMKANWYRTSVQLNSPNRIRLGVAPRRWSPPSPVTKGNGDLHASTTSDSGNRTATQKDTPRGTRRLGNNDTTAKRQALFVFGACRAIGHGAAAPDSTSEQVIYRYVARSRSWWHVSKLPQRRIHYAVAASSRCVYVTGGGIASDISEDKIVPTKTVLRWSAESNTWSQVAPLCSNRMQHCSVCVADRIYVIGGCQSSRSFLSSVECYSNAWTEVTQLRLRRMGACAVAYRHGILVAGGYGGEDGETPVILDVVEFIDLDTFSCTDFVPLRIPRCCAAMTSLQNKVYICGGLTRNDAKTHCAVATLDIYDDRRAIWTKFTELSRSRYNAAFITLGTKLCIIGGMTPIETAPLSDVECYDLLSATWTDVVQALPGSLSEPKAVMLRY